MRRVGLIVVLGLAGCLWLEGLPPDKIINAPPIEEQALVSHCAPHEGQGRPVLLGTNWGPRTFGCRLRGDAATSWRVQFDDLDVGGFDVGQGAEEVTLDRAALPWHPAPYSALLSMRAAADGREVTYTWRLIVVPDEATLFEESTL
jgi:hypothetical protein